MRKENIYTILNLSDVRSSSSTLGGKRNAAGGLDKCPSICYIVFALRYVVSAKAESLRKQSFETHLLGHLYALEDVMFTKSGFPPKDPLSEKTLANTIYPCPYCKWVGYAISALNYHVNTYHEGVVAEEGERAREGGRKLNRFGTTDYGLPMWECLKCHQHYGPASIPYFRRFHNRLGYKCDGVLVPI